ASSIARPDAMAHSWNDGLDTCDIGTRVGGTKLRSAANPRMDVVTSDHVPFGDRAIGVLQQDIGFAVVIVVAGANHGPAGRRTDAGVGVDMVAVHLPHRDLTVDVPPEDIGLAVAVEVAGASHMPIRARRADRAVRGDVVAIHLPHRDLALAVLPHDIGLAIAVED